MLLATFLRWWTKHRHPKNRELVVVFSYQTQDDITDKTDGKGLIHCFVGEDNAYGIITVIFYPRNEEEKRLVEEVMAKQHHEENVELVEKLAKTK